MNEIDWDEVFKRREIERSVLNQFCPRTHTPNWRYLVPEIDYTTIHWKGDKAWCPVFYKGQPRKLDRTYKKAVYPDTGASVPTSTELER